MSRRRICLPGGGATPLKILARGWHGLTGSSQDRSGQPDGSDRALRRGDRLVHVS